MHARSSKNRHAHSRSVSEKSKAIPNGERDVLTTAGRPAARNTGVLLYRCERSRSRDRIILTIHEQMVLVKKKYVFGLIPLDRPLKFPGKPSRATLERGQNAIGVEFP